MSLKIRDLDQQTQWLSSAQRLALKEVIAASFAGVSPDEYMQYYFDDPKACQRKLRLYFDHSTLVGYCLLTFTQHDKSTVIRASAAFYPQYRNGGNTFSFSLYHSIRYWLTRPWGAVYYADTMLSPAMYRAIAKHVAIIWPHPDCSSPNALFEHFNAEGRVSPGGSLRCLKPVNRASNYSISELAAFQASDKKEIAFYCKMNPNFDAGMGLFVIIPIHTKQVIYTLGKRLLSVFKAR
ncbi:hypothetical protein EXT46_01145 [Pseudoalteromonas sp. CO325X]|uniref:hypothetical protein n=1 Tax=Pseudoalteromonas sp. CO325X TaxID=1777262 RepID=UPI001023AC4A|nr:hypothetical protein [Pseudoalteromonas sp. CO325X]RZF88085.1 hypothetical protein EXT46_01145 [Pseudoalteromonas sp. CO325X]